VSLENIIVGEVEKTEIPEKMKIAKEADARREKGLDLLFERIDSKLKKVGDTVSFSLKEGIDPRMMRGPGLGRRLGRERRGEWETFWDAEAKKMYVQKIK
jgi:hypothetical protein